MDSHLEIAATMTTYGSLFEELDEIMSSNVRQPFTRRPSSTPSFALNYPFGINTPSTLSSSEAPRGPSYVPEMLEYVAFETSHPTTSGLSKSLDFCYGGRASQSTERDHPAVLENLSCLYGSQSSSGSYASNDYLFTAESPLTDPASACPRSYPNSLEIQNTEAAGNTLSDAYPPLMFLRDPGKQVSSFSPPDPFSFAGDPRDDAQSGPSPGSRTDGASQTVEACDSPPRSLPSVHAPGTKLEQGLGTPSDYTLEDGDVSKSNDEGDLDGDQPYAKLIYRALMSVPGHRMVLREIYEWFETHTDKAKDPKAKGWQNSIRHNLSMNGAFRKDNQDAPSEDAKRGYVWALEPSAIKDGVKSTTRYRKSGSAKKAAKPGGITSLGTVSGRKGGSGLRRARSARVRRSGKAAAIGMSGSSSSGQSVYVDSCDVDAQGGRFPSANYLNNPEAIFCGPVSHRPAMPDFHPLAVPRPEAGYDVSLADIFGISDHADHQSLFYNGHDISEDSTMSEPMEDEATEAVYHPQYQ